MSVSQLGGYGARPLCCSGCLLKDPRILATERNGPRSLANPPFLTDGAFGSAAERQDVASSLVRRLASVSGGPRRCSLEGALASAAISIAPVAGDLDTVVGVGGG